MIAVIDYRAGNLRSVHRAVQHLGIACSITSDAATIRSASRVIFPGVGAAGSAMETIRALKLDEVIHEVISRGIPFLGICLGTQIILDGSEEDSARCLGIIPGMVRRFPEAGEKIPHMGWNTIEVIKDHPVLQGIDTHAQFYFVHSFYPDAANVENIVAQTEYGITFPSVLARDNIVATQFHPEKSGRYGLSLLKNFSLWDGSWG
ncbi:MAG: imidazole glycerol phosphate synthase subunit HisH [Desulfomonilia bacterium]|nr:imidazole glycerol phosphate synthase subunit HisH [Desulfomonilia bacterium]